MPGGTGWRAPTTKRNAFTLHPSIAPEQIIENFGGVRMTENGNLVNGRRVDILAAYNAANDPDLVEVPAWSPLLRRTVHPAVTVPVIVAVHSGPLALGLR